MVGYTYANVSVAQAQTYFDKTGSYKSHTDVVVARRAGLGWLTKQASVAPAVPSQPTG